MFVRATPWLNCNLALAEVGVPHHPTRDRRLRKRLLLAITDRSSLRTGRDRGSSTARGQTPNLVLQGAIRAFELVGQFKIHRRAGFRIRNRRGTSKYSSLSDSCLFVEIYFSFLQQLALRRSSRRCDPLQARRLGAGSPEHQTSQ